MSNRYLITAVLACSAIAITACAPNADLGDDPPAENAEVSAIGAVGTVGSPTLTVAGGLAFSCAAGSSGIRCWGSDSNGQLGDNATTTGPRIQPVAVTGIQFGTGMLSTGGLYTCAAVNGAAKCWGRNMEGQLGNGQVGNDMPVGLDSHVPVDVTNLSSGVQAIATGNSHACAVVNGAASCWGSNNFGQVGDGSVAVTVRRSPRPVSNLGSGVQAITAGEAHSCAIVNGAAMCWGLNTSGQLGNAAPGDPPPGNSSVPVPVTGLTSGVIAIAAGQNHTCAIVTGGAVKCWGSNTEGQLGNSSTGGSAATAVPVTGLTSGAIAITAGEAHTCAIAANGAAKCWGRNMEGQLGDGSPDPNDPVPDPSNQPVQVTGLTSGVQNIAAGSKHTCATTVAGNVFCWGDNTSAQIAADPNTASLFAAPRQITGLVLGGCADGTDEQVFSNGMVGCSGAVAFPNRGALCAAGYRPATSLQWSTNRGAGIPGHHYWTNDPLLYGGDGPSACFVSMSVGFDCGTDTPMRVCAVNNTDPEGNYCNWTQCGLYTNANQYFGGCAGNTTAGTLCIPNIDPPSACSQYNSCPKWENGYATSTSKEDTGIAGNTVSCTQFCADAGVCNPASCGQMSAPTAACNSQATTRLNQVKASIASSVAAEASFDSVAALQARSSAAQSAVSVTTGYHVADWGFSQNCGFTGGGAAPGFVVGGGGGGGGGTGCQLFWSQALVCDVNITAPSPSSAQNDACGCAH